MDTTKDVRLLCSLNRKKGKGDRSLSPPRESERCDKRVCRESCQLWLFGRLPSGRNNVTDIHSGSTYLKREKKFYFSDAKGINKYMTELKNMSSPLHPEADKYLKKFIHSFIHTYICKIKCPLSFYFRRNMPWHNACLYWSPRRLLFVHRKNQLWIYFKMGSAKGWCCVCCFYSKVVNQKRSPLTSSRLNNQYT